MLFCLGMLIDQQRVLTVNDIGVYTRDYSSGFAEGLKLWALIYH